MMVFSQMHNIITNTAVSFSHNEIMHIKDNSLERDQYLFKHKRWETTPVNTFKFLVIQIVHKHQANKFDVFRILNEITKEELDEFRKEKEKIVLYKRTINEDISYVKTKIVTPANIIKMYNKNEISLVGLYYYLWHFNKINKLSRIQDKKLRQTMLFFDYFPVVKDWISTIYDGNNSKI